MPPGRFCITGKPVDSIDDTHLCPATPTPPPGGAFVGSDLSGVVVKLGPNLQRGIKIGDVVGASVVGSKSSSSRGLSSSSKTDRYRRSWRSLDDTSGRGAFAEYAKAYSDLIWKVPEGTYSFEEVAATGIP